MSGFNYGGGVGDGTWWSSERGKEPDPGGGSKGTGGELQEIMVTVTQKILRQAGS